jgi:hypothetical protein
MPAAPVFQEVGSKNCGPTVLQRVGQLIGRPDITVQRFLAENRFGPQGETTYLPQLAVYLRYNGVGTRLLTFGGRALHPSWEGSSHKELIQRLSDRLPPDPSDFTGWDWNTFWLEAYVRAGGPVNIAAPPSEADIIQWLDQRWLIIASVDETAIWLRNARGGSTPDGHAILIEEHDDLGLEVYDPYPTCFSDSHGRYSSSASQILTAIGAWNSQLVLVHK